MARLNNNLISTMASNRVLDAAYAWLRSHRLNAHHNNLFWSLSLNWHTIRARLRTQLQAGTYQLSPVTQQQRQNEGFTETVSYWEPLDSIVLKAMAVVLTPLLNTRIDLIAATHLKELGGLKKAVTTMQQYSKKNTFIIKTDIADYYQSMNHHLLHSQLCEHISDKRVQSLLWQVMNRVHVRDGSYRLITNKSIPGGCPLSPLLAAVYLAPLDKCVKKNRLDYVRHIDDFVIFTKKRHQLKRILKRVYRALDCLGLKLSHDKTRPGRVDKGISFLGYDISPCGIDLSPHSFNQMLTQTQRLYEQDIGVSRLTKYARLWTKDTTGSPFDIQKLNFKITTGLQNTFHIRLELDPLR